MWRASGKGELYTYLPLGPTNVNACEASGDGAICNNETFGLSFGRGNFVWPKGQWVTAEERVRLNDVGSNNGESFRSRFSRLRFAGSIDKGRRTSRLLERSL